MNNILNKEQQAVVNELEKNILLIASAGTGKTNTLAERISNIIKSKKAKGNEILCITFTNKACKEMQDRILKTVKEDGKDITIKTFHSFCYDIIKRETKKNSDVFSDFTIFDEADCLEIAKTCNILNHPIKILLNFINLIKEYRMKKDFFKASTLEDYKETINHLKTNNLNIIEDVCKDKGKVNNEIVLELLEYGATIVSTYDGTLAINHGVDFNDLICKCKELLNNDLLVKELREKYKYINIDEVQDTSYLEYSIIQKIFANNNILLCGDKFQTIYTFRGSDPNKIFNEYIEKFKPIEVVFTKNYRSTKTITDASTSYLESAFSKEMKEIYKDSIEANSEDIGEKIIYKEVYNIESEATHICNMLNSLSKKGLDIKRSCILTRNNFYNIELSNTFKRFKENEGLPFEVVLVDEFKFFRRQEIKDILAFMKLIINCHDSVSLKRILNRLKIGIGERTLEEIESKSAKEIGITLSDFINPNIKYGEEKFSLLIEQYEMENIIIFDVESTGIDVTEDEIIQIAAIKINKNGDIVERFEKLLKNKKPVGTSAFVHGFTDEILKTKGEEKSKVLREFINFSENALIVGHNVEYDINILNSELSRNNLGHHKFLAHFDTLDIYRRFEPKLINHKLETLSEIFKTNHKPSHNAMDDIIATGELLIRALKEYIVPTSLNRISFMLKYIEKFKLIKQSLNNFIETSKTKRPYEIVEIIVKGFKFNEIYKYDIEKMDRIRNLYALLKSIDSKYKSNIDELIDVLKLTSLSNGEMEEIIVNRKNIPRIPIITIHQAKGLEFDYVFLAGLQEGEFPSLRSIKSNELDEEKRLFYVAITRAKRKLYLSHSKRSLWNKSYNKSSFIDFIPKKYIEEIK